MPKLGETIETPTGEVARQRAGQQPFTLVTESSPLLPSINVQSARVSGTNDGSSGNSTARQGGSPFSTSLSSALVAEIAYCTVSAGNAHMGYCMVGSCMGFHMHDIPVLLWYGI